jgi:hypothetical protein
VITCNHSSFYFIGVVIIYFFTQEEAETLTKDVISEKWRLLLQGSGIDPIDMHPPLGFWSRNGFLFDLK